MKRGRASQTAELVCMGRAVAHGAIVGTGFEDPTAFELLSDADRLRVERARGRRFSKNPQRLFDHLHLRQLSGVMVARTVSIDRAIAETAAGQVVILGAGLDGRAWRMPELRDAVVFEVDHPDSQRDKRARVERLRQTAREVRFVPIDFELGALDQALVRAGHDPARKTAWLWEGVVMYLEPRDIEASLAVIERRSAPGSRLVIVYHSPSILLHFVNFITRRMGEPLKSHLKPDAMRALLLRHGFRVLEDRDMRTIGAELSADVKRMTEHVRHMRTVVAERA